MFVNHAPHEAKKSGWLLREPQPGGSFGNLLLAPLGTLNDSECDKLTGHLVDFNQNMWLQIYVHQVN